MSGLETTGRHMRAPIAKLHTSKFHHRTNWGDMVALAASIKATGGAIEPVVARPHPTIVDEFEVVAGERRRRATTAAGFVEIDIIVQDLDDVTTIEWQARENLERQDLHALDEADYFEDLIQHGWELGEVAKRFGRKRDDVTRSLRLRQLSPSARKAYADLEIDNRSAMALCRLDSLDKQGDVIAAFRNGALTNEEIPSYCQREYSAPMADLPWALTDADMPGGACTTCPKRANVQRDLFSDHTGADRCLDVACWRAKMVRTWETWSAEPAYTALDTEAPMLFIPQAGGRPVVMKSSGYVDSAGSCPHLSGHTWEEAIVKGIGTREPPAIYLVRDQDGRPRLLYREASATRLVKKSEAGKEEARIQEAGDPVKPPPNHDKRIRKAIVDQIAARASEKDIEAWGWVVERILELVTTRSVGATVQQFELTNDAALVEFIREASNRKRKQVAIAMLARDVADVAGELPQALLDLATLAEIDIKAIEKAIRKEHDDDA